MKSISALKNGLVALALGFGAATVPGSSSFAAPAPPSAPRIEITTQELAASNAKVEAAYSALIDMWRADFKAIGERFAAPGIARYRAPIRTACGVMMPNNAGYCAADNDSIVARRPRWRRARSAPTVTWRGSA